ncbi:MAG: ABC transporter ATP-binding protein [Burkholderiales bacterium]|nr:ABC transporter ATP-binding protein [Burkholderiales bacterium]
MTALLEARALRKSFGGVRAVEGISLAVPERAIFAVIGPNGAGKSTLMNLLSGTYQPDSGELLFAGRQLVGLPAHRRVRLGLARTFQKIRLFKQLTLLDNVLAGFHIHHRIPAWQYLLPAAAFWRDWTRCREEGMALLEFVGLADRAFERAGALAYGQQRMLEIARALATGPKLFMLDEPAAGLNSAEVGFLLQRLIDIRARGITVVVVEHNMDLVMNVADHVFVMDHGEYLFQGKPREVQDNPQVIEAYLGGEFVGGVAA